MEGNVVMKSRKQWVLAASGALMVAIPLIALAQVGLMTAYWGFDANVLAWGSTNIVIEPAPPVSERRWTGIAAVAPPTLVWLAALSQLFLLLRGFSQGALIDAAGVRRLRNYALLAGLATILDIAGSGARRWALGEFSGEPLWTHIQIPAHVSAMIFTTLIIFLVSFALEEGYAFREETERYL